MKFLIMVDVEEPEEPDLDWTWNQYDGLGSVDMAAAMSDVLYEDLSIQNVDIWAPLWRLYVKDELTGRKLHWDVRGDTVEAARKRLPVVSGGWRIYRTRRLPDWQL